MARLPSFGETSRRDKINIEVGNAASPGMRFAGQEWEARGQLGKEIANFTSTLLQKRQESADRNEAENARNDFMLDASLVRDNANKQYSGTDYKGYTEYLNKEFDSLKDRYSKKLSSGALDRFSNSINDSLLNLKLKASTTENIERSKYNYKQFGNRADKIALNAYNTGDAIAASNDLLTYETSLDEANGIDLTNAEVIKLKEDTRKLVTDRTFKSMLDNNNFEGAKKLLYGGDRFTQNLTDSITSEMMNSYRDQLRKKEKQLKDSDLMMIFNDAKDASSALSNPEATPKAKQQAIAVLDQVKAIPEDDPEIVSKKKDALVTLEASKKLGTALSGIKYENTANLKKGSDLFPVTDIKNAEVNARAAHMYDNAVAETIKQKNSDGYAFVTENFGIMPKEKNYETQKKLGVVQPRYVSKQESFVYGMEYNSAPNAESKFAALQKMNKELGRGANIGIQDMVNDGTLPPYVFHINNIQNEQTKISLLNARDMEKAKLFDDKSLNAAGIGKADIYSKTGFINKDIGPVLDAIGDTKRKAAIEDDIAVLAMAKIKGNTGKSADDAVKEAYAEVVGNHYHFIGNNKSKLAIPKNTTNNVYIVRDTETVIDNPTKLVSAKGLSKDSFDNFKFKDEQSYNRAMEEFQVISDPSMQFGYLTLINAQGKREVLYNKGKPVTLDYKDIDVLAPKIRSMRNTQSVRTERLIK